MLFVICGNIASGKSTVAKLIQERFGGLILETNDIRDQMYPNPTYSNNEVQNVYDIFFEKTESALKEGIVILDATFSNKSNRKKATEIAKKLSLNYFIIELIGPSADIVEKRINDRKESKNKTNFQQYLNVKRNFDPVIEEKIVIENIGSLDELRSKVFGLSLVS